MSAYVYIVECSDGSLYTGWTTNIERRLDAHNDGTGAKYTRSRRPVELKMHVEMANRSDAMRLECEIKRLSRKKKLELTTFLGQIKELVKILQRK